MQFVPRAFASDGVRHSAFTSVLAVTLALLVSGCSENTDPEPAPTLSEAAENYLATVCPVNLVWGEVDVAVDALQIEQDRGESGNPHAVYKSLAEVESASRHAAEQLSNYQWPESAQTNIEGIVDALEADADHAKKARDIPVNKLSEYVWPGAKKSQELAAQARQTLHVTQTCEEFLEDQEADSNRSEDTE